MDSVFWHENYFMSEYHENTIQENGCITKNNIDIKI